MNSIIQNYKTHIRTSEMKDELYKWELVSTFRGRPNTLAPDFAEEYRSLKFGNLIYAMAGGVGKHLSTDRSEEFRTLFIHLFDESIPLNERVAHFNQESLIIYRSLGIQLGHHQDERTISVYLTYHNPEKYTFYKNSYYNAYCKFIGIKPAGKNEKYGHYLDILNKFIKEFIIPDQELIELVKEFLPEYYDGTNHLLLAQDILRLTFDNPIKATKRYWKFAPGENAIRWNDFKLANTMQMAYPELSEEVIKNATTKEELRTGLGLPTSSKKLQNLNNFIFEGQEGDIVFANKGRSTIVGVGIISGSYECVEDSQQYNHTRSVDWIADKEWNYIPNSIERYPVLFAMDTFSETPNGAWILNEYLKAYPEYQTRFNHSTKTEMTKKTPLNQILYGPPGTGKTHRLKTDFFPKYTTKETAITPEQHFEEVVRELTWWQVIAIAVMELGKCKVGDLMKHKWILQKAKISNSNTVRPTLWGQLQSHTIESCEFVNVKSKQQPFIFNKTEDSYWEILEEEVKEFAPELYDIIESVNNFQPNPEKEIKRYVFTTFHQSFNYEDFIEGIKPVLNDGQESEQLTYKIEDGIFKELCKRAESDPENQYAIFIDEINRGNVSAIFGELITLIETDKRKGGEHPMSANLPYSKKPFTVPSNVDIIGTMNTADRSVEALDTALRRRFSFVEMLPQPELLSPSAMITRLFWKYENHDWEDPEYKPKESALREFLQIPENSVWESRKDTWNNEMKNGDRNRLTYLNALNDQAKFNLQSLLTTINNRIEALVDRDHTIGHAYFMNVHSAQSLQEAFAKNIIPLLQEYFYGNYAKMEMVIGPYFFVNQENSPKVTFAVMHNEFADYSTKTYQLHDVSKMNESDFMDAIQRLLDPKFVKDKPLDLIEQAISEN